MTRRFILRPRAENDIQSAFEWYESQRLGLGDEFLTAIREKLEAVRSSPESSPVIYRDVRRAVVSRFPYLIFYVVRPTRVSVLAILHTRAIPLFGLVGNVLANMALVRTRREPACLFKRCAAARGTTPR